MEFWKQILQILDLSMQTPTPYGWFHILSLALTFLTTALLCLRGRSWSADRVRRLLLHTALLVIGLEVYKQINFTFGDGSGTPAYQWYAFPWQFCSTPMYIGLLAGLTRKGRVHQALCAYLATFSLFAGLAVMFYPTSVFIETIGINIQTMVCHGSMVVIGIFLLASGYVKLEHKTILRAMPVFAVMVLMAAVMNEAAYRSGLLEEHTFNMFFISPYCDPSLPVYSLVQQYVAFPWSLVIYIAGFTAAGYALLLIGMGVRKLLRAHGPVRQTNHMSAHYRMRKLRC